MNQLKEESGESIFDEIALKEALLNADIPIIAFRLSPFGIMYINKIFEKEWEISLDTLLQNPNQLAEIIYEPDREEFIEKVIKDPLSNCYESIKFRIITPNHQEKKYVLTLYPLWIQKKLKGTIGFVENNSNNQQQEKDMQVLYNEVENYIQKVRHDLKGMIGNMGMIVSMLKNKINLKQQQDISESLELANEVCKETLSYINTLSGEFLTNSQDLTLEETNIGELIYEVVELHRPKFEDKKLSMKLKVPEAAVLAKVDKIKFRQMLNNLLSNAIKFSHVGGPIRIALKSMEKNMLISVEDRGLGIPSSIQSFIFENHSKAARKGTREEASSGLGTYIIKDIVDKHNGKVWFESEEEVGTTFLVQIPK